MKVGILGCGVISGIYIENIKRVDALELTTVADVNPDAARYRAEQYGVPRACSPDELLADPEVEIVVNVTPNRLHGPLGLEVVEAGKHLYSEKPLTVYREESVQLLAAANQRGRCVGGAPDTFLGGAWQTARRAIDRGLIGEPFAALALLHWGRSSGLMQSRPVQTSATRSTAPGAVSFFQTEGYKYGVTVAFDMGPYYLNNLVNLLGPVRSVVGSARKVHDEQLRFGNVLKVEAPTHVAGILEYQSGVICQVVFSSDALSSGLPDIEIFGTEGTLRCPDPNVFPGVVHLRPADRAELVEVPCAHGYNQDSRGVGVADMAAAIEHGRPIRASGEMAAHAVDVITALHESAESGRRIDLTTTCSRPAPLPTGLPDWYFAE